MDVRRHPGDHLDLNLVESEGLFRRTSPLPTIVNLIPIKTRDIVPETDDLEVYALLGGSLWEGDAIEVRIPVVLRI